MTAGRPRKVDPGALYVFAHEFYWDLRRVLDGHPRWKFDEGEYKATVREIDSQEIHLTDDQNRAIARVATKEEQYSRMTGDEKKARLRDLTVSNLEVTRDFLRMEAADRARKQVWVPGKPGVIKKLLHARTPEQIRTVCKDALVLTTIQIEPGVTKQLMMPNWPIPVGSVLPRYLSEHASEFIAAKNDKRFPVSGRPTSQLKQLWFLSRALAGALFGVRVRTAINLVGSKRPEQMFEEARAGKPRRSPQKK